MRFSADFEDGVTTFVPNRKGIAEVAATQYKRVVLEGPVRNRQDGTFLRSWYDVGEIVYAVSQPLTLLVRPGQEAK